MLRIATDSCPVSAQTSTIYPRQTINQGVGAPTHPAAPGGSTAAILDDRENQPAFRLQHRLHPDAPGRPENRPQTGATGLRVSGMGWYCISGTDDKPCQVDERYSYFNSSGAEAIDFAEKAFLCFVSGLTNWSPRNSGLTLALYQPTILAKWPLRPN